MLEVSLSEGVRVRAAAKPLQLLRVYLVKVQYLDFADHAADFGGGGVQEDAVLPPELCVTTGMVH